MLEQTKIVEKFRGMESVQCITLNDCSGWPWLAEAKNHIATLKQGLE